MTPTEIEKNLLDNFNPIPPKEYNSSDMLLHITLYQIYYMFRNNIISKNEGTLLKNTAFEKHKLNSFGENLWQKHIENIRPTEILRCELRKNPNLDTALKLIEIYSGEPTNLRKEVIQDV